MSVNANKRGVRGAGSISKRSDGRWIGRYTVILPDGRHKVMAVYGKTQGEVREKLTQCLARRDKGEITNGGGLTVGDFYEIWMGEIVENYLRPTTIELYKRLFHKYILPVLGKKKLASLGVDDVQRCFNLTKRYSDHQAQVVKKALSSMLVRAKKRQLIFANPTRDIEAKAIKSNEPAVWDKQQLRCFLDEARESSSYYLAYAIMATYGLRRGEVLGIRWEDVDFTMGCIHIRQQIISLNNKPQVGELKTDSSKRDLPLNNQLKALLSEQHSSNAKGLVFQTKNGTPLAPRNFYRDFQKVAKRAGLPHIKIHALRHMAACFMRDEGIDPKTCQSILGHSTLDTTLKIYQHSDMEHKKGASDKMGNLLFSRSSHMTIEIPLL